MSGSHALKLAQLRFFCAVVEEGSVIGAARRMNCVASNVTTRLRELEQTLGQELFQRERGRLLLSPAGKLFYREAGPVLADTARLARLFEPDQPRGLLAIGALDVALDGFLAARLPDFIARHPGIEFQLLRRPSYVLERMLSDGEIDLALTDGPIVHPLLDSRFAFTEALVLMTPAATGDIEDIDWSATRVFLFNTDCFYRNRLEAWLKARGLQPDSVQTMESYALMHACIRAGLGVGCFPASMLPPDGRPPLDGVALWRPDDLQPSPVYFVWRREAPDPTLLSVVDALASPEDVHIK